MLFPYAETAPAVSLIANDAPVYFCDDDHFLSVFRYEHTKKICPVPYVLKSGIRVKKRRFPEYENGGGRDIMVGLASDRVGPKRRGLDVMTVKIKLTL